VGQAFHPENREVQSVAPVAGSGTETRLAEDPEWQHSNLCRARLQACLKLCRICAVLTAGLQEYKLFQKLPAPFTPAISERKTNWLKSLCDNSISNRPAAKAGLILHTLQHG
jgi:hypothetical protein